MAYQRQTLPCVLLGLLLPGSGFLLLADSPPAPDKPKSPEASLAKTTPKILVETVHPKANAPVVKNMPVANPLADEPKGADEPPPEVIVTQPVAREVTDHMDFTGRTEAVEMVELRARVTGYLNKIHFKAGEAVKKGDLLFEIDPRPFQAQLDHAMSQIKLNEVSLKLAQSIFKRDLAVAEAVKGTVTELQLDQDKVAVEEAQARLDSSKAGARVYQLNLEFTKVTSPIDGEILKGDLEDKQDATVKTGDVLFEIGSDHDLRGELSVDDRDIQNIRDGSQGTKASTGTLATNAQPGESFKFVVDRIIPIPDPKEGANNFRVYVRITDPKPMTWRPGMKGEARVDVEHKSLAWIWTHRLVDFLRLKLWM